MDNLIPNTEMIRGAGRLYYSQREAEQAKVVLQVCNLPKIAMESPQGVKISMEVSNDKRTWWPRGKERFLRMGAVPPLNPSLKNRLASGVVKQNMKWLFRLLMSQTNQAMLLITLIAAGPKEE